MKNLLVSIVALVLVCLALSSASADPLTKNVIGVQIKDTKSQYVYYARTFPEPVSALQKKCSDDRTHSCVYAVAGKRKEELYRFPSESLIMVAYITETKVEIASR